MSEEAGVGGLEGKGGQLGGHLQAELPFDRTPVPVDLSPHGEAMVAIQPAL
jgi:hypothetical protein